MNKRSKKLSNVWVILIGIVGALVLTWAAALLGFFNTQETPIQLPPTPEQVKSITGIDLPGFHYAVPVVQGVSGDLYHFDFYEDSTSWLPVDRVEYSVDTACTQKSIDALENSAGPVTGCRETVTNGELCPGPIMAYAIDADGNVWEFESTAACWVEMVVLYGFAGFVGLMLGAGIIAVRWLIGRRKTNSFR